MLQMPPGVVLLLLLFLLQHHHHSIVFSSSSPSSASSSSLLHDASSSSSLSPSSSSSSSSLLHASSSSSSSSSSSALLIRRSKRQWGDSSSSASFPFHESSSPSSSSSFQCPPQCFSCTPMHCQAYQCIQPQMVPMIRCCCRPVMIVRPQPDLKTACDGEEAVAACLNGLCGQGYFCQRNRFCCRCPAGKSIGRCVNGLCPAGYVCNSNDFCCAVGNLGSAIGPCVNGECPDGYECGEGDLCYPRSGSSSLLIGTPTTRHFPLAISRSKRPRWGPPKGRNRKKGNGKTRGRGSWWERRSGRGRMDPWPWGEEKMTMREWETEGEEKDRWNDDYNDLRK